MATLREVPPVEFDQAFLSSEIDHLINSAHMRIEQQRIHLSLLGGNINPERTRARRDLQGHDRRVQKTLGHPQATHRLIVLDRGSVLQ